VYRDLDERNASSNAGAEKMSKGTEERKNVAADKDPPTDI